MLCLLFLKFDKNQFFSIMAKNILNSSLENASFNILFQVFCRCITFVLNAFVVRHVGEAALGVMNVRLLLLESMILFLSREPFFKACLTNSADHNWAQVINLLWLTIPTCVFMCFVFGYLWLFTLTTSEALPSYYTFAVVAVAVSCVIYLSSLAVELVASAFLFVRFKIVVDTITILFRTLLFMPMILYNPENALLAFGVAQLASMMFHTVAHYVYFHWYIKRLNIERQRLLKKMESSQSDDDTSDSRNSEVSITDFPFKSIKDFFPGQLENEESRFDENLVKLTWSFFKQSILMQILTEGERMIMTIARVLTFAEQGTYDVVNNLGSLAARFIFRPIEESGYFYFTQIVQRDKPINEQNPVTIRESADVLMHLCTAVTSIGLVVLVFGQSYSSTLLWLYGGAKLTAYLPVLLMRAHCLAVLLLAINGVTECYKNATANSKTINKSNLMMIYQSIAFLLASYIFTWWLGPVGFIFGNCVNMSLRIYHSVSFINQRHGDSEFRPLRGIVPKPLFTAALITSALVTNVSHMYFFPAYKLVHLAIGVVMFFIVIVSWAYENSGLIKLGIDKWRNRKMIQRSKVD